MSETQKMKFLNLGCGNRFHRDWENLDFVAASSSVRAHDLRKGIPFADGTFDVVYHSHVLEHFSKHAAPSFIKECFRVLKSGGVLRVAVPDLENIARLYLETLEKASNNVPGWHDNYNWMVLEMYDQTVRERSCGELVKYFQQEPIPNWDFVFKRWGVQASVLRDSLQNKQGTSEPQTVALPFAWSYVRKNLWEVLRNKLTKAILKPADWEALQVARFRSQGEIHMWMYDSFSLTQLLEQAGFANPRRFDAAQSQIPNWSNFHLDTEPDGSTYKPDSLFMEGIRI